MPGSSNILREFLVAIGFDVDADSYRDFNSKLKAVNQKFEGLAKVATATALAVSATLIETASEMERLYFISERTGSSVQRLFSMRFAGRQAGIADLTQSVETMAAAMRSNPGLQAFFGFITGQRPTGNAGKDLITFVERLKQIPFFMAQQFAAQFGIDPQTLFMLEKHLQEVKDSQEFMTRQAGRAGISLDKIGEQSHQFMNDVRRLLASVELLGSAFGGKLLPFADEVVRLLQSAVDFALALNKATNGWSTAIGGIVVALGGVLGTLRAIRSIAAFLGIGGGAAATGEAAGAATGAGAGGLAAGGLLTADALLLWHDIKQGKQLYQAYKQSGNFTQLHSTISDYISRFEGFSSRMYRDAGHFSIGFGHQVKSGENFSGGISRSRAMQLLGQDISSAQATVLSLVHARLNANQLAALTDLVYNIGAGNFAGSTLLRDLNAGNFSGAADQFARFDKVKTGSGYAESADLLKRRLADRELFTRPVTMSQKTDIHIAGSNDPSESARQVKRSQNDVNSQMLRNLQGVVQ